MHVLCLPARTCFLFEDVLPGWPFVMTMPYFPDDDCLHSIAMVFKSSLLHRSKMDISASRLAAHSCSTVVPCHAKTHSGWTVTRPLLLCECTKLLSSSILSASQYRIDKAVLTVQRDETEKEEGAYPSSVLEQADSRASRFMIVS